MKARYPGMCACTGRPIKPGDEVRSVGTSCTGRTLWALVAPAPAPELTRGQAYAQRVQLALRRNQRTTP